MVFASLDPNEVSAFHRLLDEYFESRPHIFQQLTETQSSSPSQGATSPAAAPPPAPPRNTPARATPPVPPARSPKPSPPPPSAATTSNNPPSSSTMSATSAFGPSVAERKGAPGLTAGRSWGNVDTSSKGAAFSSFVQSRGKKDEDKTPRSIPTTRAPSSSQAPPPAPPSRRDTAASATSPPPPRRNTTTSATSPPPPQRNTTTSASSASASASPPPPAPPAPPPPPAARNEIRKLRALYDFEGTESGDLSFREGDEIELVEKISDDWWKGELDGKQGIFPVVYVEE